MYDSHLGVLCFVAVRTGTFEIVCPCLLATLFCSVLTIVFRSLFVTANWLLLEVRSVGFTPGSLRTPLTRLLTYFFELFVLNAVLNTSQLSKRICAASAAGELRIKKLSFRLDSLNFFSLV